MTVGHDVLRQSDPDAVAELLATAPADVYPLTPLQKGILVYGLRRGDPGAELHQLVYDVEGTIDGGRLRAALARVVERHPVLRTELAISRFAEPLQVVRDVASPPLEELDCRDLPDAAAAECSDHRLRDDRATPFDVGRGPLMRFLWIRLGERRHRLVWTSHALLLDGWSAGRLLLEILTFHARGDSLQLPLPALSFRDYVTWHRSRDGASSGAFWRERFASFDAPSRSSTSAVPDGSATVETSRLLLSRELSDRIRAAAAAARVTLGTVFLAAWARALQRRSGASDVAFGIVVAGRPAELDGADSVVGLCINTIPFRVRLTDDRVGSWLAEIQRDSVRARRFECDSPAAIARHLGEAGAPWIDSAVVFENYPVDAELLRHAELGIDTIAVSARESLQLPCALTVMPLAAIELRLDCASGLASEVERGEVLEQLERDLVRMSEGPDARLARDPRAAVAVGASRPLPQRGLVDLFEAIVARDPAAPAILASGGAISRGELAERVERIAAGLAAAGLRPGGVVAVALRPGAGAVAALLAVLRAGGVYLPSEPGLVHDRSRRCLRAARAAFAIAEEDGLDDGLERVSLETLLRRAGPPARRPALGAEAPAYVFFTSGSTGTPVGVLASQAAVANRLAWAFEMRPYAPDDVAYLKTPLVFVDSVTEALGPLLAGIPLAEATPAAAADLDAMACEIEALGVTQLVLVPSLLRAVLRGGSALLGRLRGLRRIVSSGEPLPWELVTALRRELPGVALDNFYGSTEVCGDATAFAPDVDPGAPGWVPIGRPLHNCTAALAAGGAVPAREGEICVGGAGVAYGYVGDPRLTAERFVPHPEARRPGERWFRTGDRGRWRLDGELEWLGRADDLVKLRGIRVSLGEVERAVSRAPGVREAAVALRPGPAAGLFAAIVPDGGATLDDVRTWLLAHHPPYLVPADLQLVASLPHLPSGKVDRRALRVPASPSSPHSEPRGEMERLVAAIWADLAGEPARDLDASFFEIGGDSLRLMELAQQLSVRLRRDVPVTRLFDTATIRSLARALEGEPERPAAADGSARGRQRRAARERVPRSAT